MAFTDPTPRLAVFLVGKTDAAARITAGGLPADTDLVRDSVYDEQIAPTITVELVPHSIDTDIPVLHPRFRVACYAPTREDTIDLYFQMLSALHNANIRTNDYAMTLWHNGGPNSFIDPNTNFECTDAYFVGIAKDMA